MQDYAIRERLEAILENVTSVFMGDFDRNLDSFRLARGLAYANRRLNDEITLIIEQGKTRRLWNVERRFEHGTAFVVLHGNEDAHASEIVDHSAQLAQERAQRRNHAMSQRKAGSQMVQQASLSSFIDDKVLSEESEQTSRPAAPRRSDSQYDWRMAYLPGRDVDAVLGIDIETTGTSAWRDYIIDVGFERMNLQTPAPEGAKARDVYTETDYAADGAYDQSRLSFGVPLRCAEVANPFIAQLTGIDVTKIAGEPIFDEWPRMQQALLERLIQQPYVAHNATFEHRFFMANVEGYAEAYRNGEITILDTMPMSRHWDAGSVPSPGHPHGDNTLKRMRNAKERLTATAMNGIWGWKTPISCSWQCATTQHAQGSWRRPMGAGRPWRRGRQAHRTAPLSPDALRHPCRCVTTAAVRDPPWPRGNARRIRRPPRPCPRR